MAEGIEEPKAIRKLYEEHQSLERQASEKINDYIYEYDKWFGSLSDKELEKHFRELPLGGKANSMNSKYPEAFLRIIDKLREGKK